MDEAHSKQYDDEGFTLVENIVPPSLLARIQSETDRLIAEAADLTEGNAVYDLEPGHCAETPMVRRITRPDLISQPFAELLKLPAIIEACTRMLGTNNIRLGNCKLNVKPKDGGSAVHWHQDWAHYPHTNDSLLACGVFIDDMTTDNGPLQVFSGSHIGPVYDHTGEEGYFVGGFSLKTNGLDMADSVTLTGTAGSASFHHVRTVHGSDWNRSNSPRRILFIEVAAGDAWPLDRIDGVAGFPTLAAYKKQLLCGELTLQPRLSAAPVRMPLPAPPTNGTIYQIQTRIKNPDFVNPASRGGGSNGSRDGDGSRCGNGGGGGRWNGGGDGGGGGGGAAAAAAVAASHIYAPLPTELRPTTAKPDWWG